MIVTCTHGDTYVSIECDNGYSPDVLDDISTHAATTLIATLRALTEAGQ